jgi:hypothetical protein
MSDRIFGRPHHRRVSKQKASSGNSGTAGQRPPDIQPGSPKAGGTCFIATAAYGPRVVELRSFRDRYLRRPFGRRAIDVYEHFGPRSARFIEDS